MYIKNGLVFIFILQGKDLPTGTSSNDSQSVAPEQRFADKF